ncbi:unnamed protein product [Cuscuta campestris]|uniref:Uncharacterized protein n=1 Tax=Cuscuta campestris TaxID=132261 RepID=A0A484KYN3_9ASTE|nr:unnamed protein product [Cuscuta campestris]
MAEAEFMTYVQEFSGREAGQIGPKVTETAEADRVAFAEAVLDGPSSWFCQVGLGVVGRGHSPVGLDTPIPGYASVRDSGHNNEHTDSTDSRRAFCRDDTLNQRWRPKKVLFLVGGEWSFQKEF